MIHFLNCRVISVLAKMAKISVSFVYVYVLVCKSMTLLAIVNIILIFDSFQFFVKEFYFFAENFCFSLSILISLESPCID